jgi:hypothetical protein
MTQGRAVTIAHRHSARRFHDRREGTQVGQRAAWSESDRLLLCYILPGSSSCVVYGENAQREALERDMP